MTLGGEGVKGHDVINCNLWADKQKLFVRSHRTMMRDLLSCGTNVPGEKKVE